MTVNHQGINWTELWDKMEIDTPAKGGDNRDIEDESPPPVGPFGSSSFPVDHLLPSDEAFDPLPVVEEIVGEPPERTKGTHELLDLDRNDKVDNALSPEDETMVESGGSFDESDSSEEGKKPYRIGSLHMRRPSWQAVCGSVIVITTIALIIAAIGALSILANGEDLQTKSNLKGNKVNSPVVEENVEALMITPKYQCTEKPPISSIKCLVWDWDEKSFDDGTLVNYYCFAENATQVPYLIVMCMKEFEEWRVISDHKDKCDCYPSD